MKPELAMVASPCQNKCCLNNEDICLGCFRSLKEITEWMAASTEQRLRFLDNAKQREHQLRTLSL